MAQEEMPASRHVRMSGGALGAVGDNANVTLHFHGSLPLAPGRVRVGRPPLAADAFQDRPGLREQVTSAFEAGAVAVVSQRAAGPATQVVTGHGGVGKSQLAAQVWREFATSGDAGMDVAVWVTATSRTEIVTGYAAAAAELRLEAENPAMAASRFMDWLQATERSWLVVLDDLAEPADVRGLWPQGHGGRVLVTTRRRDPALFTHGRRRIDVDVFARPESIAYLTERLSGASAAELDALAGDVSDLPIALAQASAFILNEKTTVAAYRERLAEARLSDVLLADEGDEHERTVAATLLLNLDRADQLQPVGAAGKLARLVAVLDPNGIPETVLTCAPARRHGGLTNSGDARRALLNLDRFSLITHDPTSATQSVRTHALTQRAVREQAAFDVSATIDDLSVAVIEAVNAAGDALLDAWPEIERDAHLARSLRANAAACLITAGDHLWGPTTPPLLLRTGRSLGEAGLVHAAIEHWDRVRETALRLLGPDHPDTLTARHELASWRGEAGDPAGAARALQDLLTERLRILGPDHPDTLNTRHELAGWEGAAGKPANAASALQVLLTDTVRVVGPDHSITLTTRRNLAHWRERAGDPAGAARALQELLADHLRILGPDHPKTLNTRHNLAQAQGRAGDASGAMNGLQVLLIDYLRVMGADHPSTLFTQHSLAYWRGEAGDPAGAARALQELVTEQLRVLGPDHPDTLTSRHELAYWRGEAGDATGTVTAFDALLTDRLRVLGTDHPDTLMTRSDLAYWRGEAGDPSDAAAAFEVLLNDYRRIFGPDDPHTLIVRGNLAHWRGEAGDAVGAATALGELLAEYLRILGPDHPDTLTSRGNLAYWRGHAGDAAGAATAFEELLADRLRILGPDHPDTFTSRSQLAHWRERAASLRD
jgi:hypothetical protein